MLKKRCFLAILVLFASGLATQAAAGGLEDAWQRGKLLVGVKSDFPPFGYRDESGTLQGYDIEVARYLARALFDDTGERLELVPVTSGSRIPFLYSGWVDVIVASMTITDERKRALEFSTPYFASGSLILVPGDSPAQSLHDLAGKRVAVLEGAIQEKDLEQIAPQAIRVPFGAMGEAVEALKNKRVDAVCSDDVVVLSLARKNPSLKAAGAPFNPHPYAIAVRKGDLKFVAWINKQLAKMKTDGTEEKLRQRYLGETGSTVQKP
ncbi:MAG: substrate-binding periplasmic protein [Syntrophobacteraceae bacterium]